MIRAILNHVTSLVVSLLLAIIIWAAVTQEQNPSKTDFYLQPLPIEIINRPEGLILYKPAADQTVTVRLRAPQASWNQLQPTSFQVTADLKGLDAGLHQVPITVRAADPRVVIMDVRPPVIDVRLEKVKTRTLDVRSDILDTVPVGYSVKPPVVSPSQVAVSGPAVLVDQIEDATADIYLRGAKAPIEREVPILLRDSQGNPVPGVTVTPVSVTVKVAIEQRVGYKDVSIKTVLKGTPASGYWISNMVVAPSTVTVVGNPDVLAKVPGVIETTPIDVTGATADVNKQAALNLPDGVSVLNNSDGVLVQVAVTPILGGQTVRRVVTVQGLQRGYAATVSPDSVEVILSGSLPSLQNMAVDDVQVTVDIVGLSGGSYQLKPRVPVLPAALKVQNIIPDTVQVTITEPKTVTPTLTASPIVTSTPVISPAWPITVTNVLTTTPTATSTKSNPPSTSTPVK